MLKLEHAWAREGPTARCVHLHTGSRQVFRLWASRSWQSFPSKSKQLGLPSGPDETTLKSRHASPQQPGPHTHHGGASAVESANKLSPTCLTTLPFSPKAKPWAPGTRSAYHNPRAASRGESKKRETGHMPVRFQHRDTEIRRKRRRRKDQFGSAPLPPDLCVSVLNSNHQRLRTACAPPAPRPP